MKQILIFTTLLTILISCQNSNNYNNYNDNQQDCEKFNYANLQINNHKNKNYNVYFDGEFQGQVKGNTKMIFQIKEGNNIEIKLEPSKGNLLKLNTIIYNINVVNCSEYSYDISF